MTKKQWHSLGRLCILMPLWPIALPFVIIGFIAAYIWISLAEGWDYCYAFLRWVTLLRWVAK